MEASKLKKVIAIYLGGFMTGVALVLFPAAGSIFTSSAHHGFSSSQFGSIFTPQIIMAIISSLMASKLADKIGMKKVLLYGLFALVLSTALLTASHWLEGSTMAAFAVVLAATGFLGIGFGFSLTALNPFAYQLFAGKETSALTALHFLVLRRSILLPINCLRAKRPQPLLHFIFFWASGQPLRLCSSAILQAWKCGGALLW